MNYKPIKWQVKAIAPDDGSFSVCNAWAVYFENRNAFVVMIDNYPVLANSTLRIDSQQCDKPITQNYTVNFGANAGIIYCHWTEDV